MYKPLKPSITEEFIPADSWFIQSVWQWSIIAYNKAVV
jgi:hypothetical protein